MNGGGLVKVANGALSSLGIAKGINSLTKGNAPTSVSLKDILVQATIENGKVNFKPFDILLGSQKMTIGGSQSFDGTIDYVVKLPFIGGAAGASANSAISGLLGKPVTPGQVMNLNFGVGGTMAKPQYKLLSAGG
jgi:hypothetical protein